MKLLTTTLGNQTKINKKSFGFLHKIKLIFWSQHPIYILISQLCVPFWDSSHILKPEISGSVLLHSLDLFWRPMGWPITSKQSDQDDQSDQTGAVRETITWQLWGEWKTKRICHTSLQPFSQISKHLWYFHLFHIK